MGSLSKPKAPKDDPATVAMRARQAEELTKLDEEENRRIKRMLLAARGTRMYRGSPLTRGAVGNTAGAASGSGAGGGSASAASILPAWSGARSRFF